MERVKVAQYGIGHNHGGEKMNTFRRFPELFEVVGFCEPDEGWYEERGNLPCYQGLRRLTREELLSRRDIMAVSVETDVKDLNKAALECIQAGFHIHMDKPAGVDIKEFEQLLTLAQRTGRIVQMGYMYRYNPAIQYVMELVRSGALGEIFEIDAQMSTGHPQDYRQWLSQFPGGTMYIFGCHLIDLILSVLGEPRHIIARRQSIAEDVSLEDSGFALLEYEKALCTVRTTSVEVNGYGRRQFVVCGTKGTAEIKPLERPTCLSVSFSKDSPAVYQDSKTFVDVPGNGQRYDAQLKDLYAMVLGQKENPYSYAHELAVQRTTLACCGIPDER